MQLVILAAGHGRRFGGLKQLAPVGANGESIMDYTARAAESCGYDGIVVIVREEIRAEIMGHIEEYWPASLPVEALCQPATPGTAQAVLAARPAIRGPFAVANADDLYGEDALRRLTEHFASEGGATQPNATVRNRHVLVSYKLAQTIVADQPVTRGLCEVGEDLGLRAIVEHTVFRRRDGRYDAQPHPRSDLVPCPRSGMMPRVLIGSEPVSMNLWGFHLRMLETLGDAIEHFDPHTAARSELVLPDVVGEMVTSGRDEVHVTPTEAACIGITNPDDVILVREELARRSNSKNLASRPRPTAAEGSSRPI